jgi:prepilin-type N-terminal cleavage/methylation domain-containing protein/prepilin-type processing-associated H-X9-DG protein
MKAVHPVESAWPRGLSRSGCRCGFTLVELLVVLGVITVLVGMLLPTLSAAKQSAQRVRCLSTLRQMGLAAHLYLNESHDHYLPVKWGYNANPQPPWPPVPAGTVPSVVPHLVWPNNPAFRKHLGLTNSKVSRVPAQYICPAATLAWDSFTKDGYLITRSYGYNTTTLSGWANPPTFYMGHIRRAVRRPWAKLMFVDATDVTVGQGGSARWDQFGEAYEPPPNSKLGITAYRHRRGANIVFFDAHAEWLPKGQVINNAMLWNPTK